MLREEPGMALAMESGMRIMNIAFGVVIFGALIFQISGDRYRFNLVGQSGKPSIPASTDQDPSLASPDGRYIVETGKGALSVFKVFDGSRRDFALPGEVADLWWSPDSQRLTAILRTNTPDPVEQLVILQVDSTQDR